MNCSTVTPRRPLLVAAFSAAAITLLVVLAFLASASGTPPRVELRGPGRGTAGLEAATSPREVTVEPLQEGAGQMPGAEGADLRYRPGDVFRYSFECRQSVTTDMTGAAASVKGSPGGEASVVTLEARLRGALTVKVHEATETGWTLGYEFARLAASVTASTAASSATPDSHAAIDTAGLTSAMTTEALVACERSGRLRGLRFRKDVPADARNLLRGLISRLQVVLPEDAGSRGWQAVEEDPTGRCLVTYSRDNGDVLTKRKERYLEAFHGGTLDVAAAITVKGETRVELKDEAPVRIAGTELLGVQGPGLAGSIAVEDEHRFELEAREFSERIALEGVSGASLAGLEPWLSFAPEAGAEAAFGEVDALELGAALERIEALFRREERSTPEAIQLLRRIADLVRGQEDGSARVLELLEKRKDDTALWQSLAGILGEAGTKASQEALVAILMGEEWPEAWRGTALLALAQAERPLAELDGLLQSLHEEGGDLAANALLVLGAAGRRLREIEPERCALIEEYVIEAARRAGTEPQTAVFALEAIGNLGPDEVPAAVFNAYHAGEDVVRASAVRAVRHSAEPAANRLILAALARDSSEDVRVEAVTALAARDPNAPALREVLALDPSERVRRRAARELSAAGNDPCATVRDRLSCPHISIRTATPRTDARDTLRDQDAQHGMWACPFGMLRERPGWSTHHRIK